MYKGDWCVDDCYETEYFCTFKELYAYLKKYFPKAVFDYYDRLSDIKESIGAV